jgi:hypothetical protein
MGFELRTMCIFAFLSLVTQENESGDTRSSELDLMITALGEFQDALI